MIHLVIFSFMLFNEKMAALRQYQAKAASASLAFHQKKFRDAADLYWQAYTISPGQWAENRFVIFTGYTSILREKYFVPSQQDLDRLQKVFKDEGEPVLYRTEAGFTLGLMCWDRNDREEAASYYRKTISVAEGAPGKELRRTVRDGLMQQKKAEDIILKCTKTCAENLWVLENPTPQEEKTKGAPVLRSDGTVHYPSKHLETPCLDNDELLRRTAVGGKECDRCHVPRSDLGVDNLSACSRCRAAYYCGRDCQRAAWSAGHKEACRKPEERRIGDIMRLINLEKKPELNGRVVVLMSEEPGDKWKAKLYMEERILLIPSSKLTHLRPAK